MTHKEIYTKFMIEYDKADSTTSYPSLTKHEIAVILNKAYLALIALKVTGNNPRQSSFESDTKAISDLDGLVTAQGNISVLSAKEVALNASVCLLPNDLLYFVFATVKMDKSNPYPVTLTSHENAKLFFKTESNWPWVKNVVAFIEEHKLYLLYDSFKHKENSPIYSARITYIKQPLKFSKDFDGLFELNDSVAEELINLAIIMAAENVESPRFNSKITTRPLES